jgi:hypothetical protein
MTELQIENMQDFVKVFQNKQSETINLARKIAQEVAEKEMELFELQLFLSSSCEREIKKVNKKISDFRKKVSLGEMKELENYVNSI